MSYSARLTATVEGEMRGHKHLVEWWLFRGCESAVCAMEPICLSLNSGKFSYGAYAMVIGAPLVGSVCRSAKCHADRSYFTKMVK